MLLCRPPSGEKRLGQFHASLVDHLVVDDDGSYGASGCCGGRCISRHDALSTLHHSNVRAEDLIPGLHLGRVQDPFAVITERGARGRRRAETRHVTDRDAAVAGSDIVITATPGGGALFSRDAVQPGTHLNCVGADTEGKRELPAGLLKHVRLFADDLIQARSIGESQWARDVPCTTLGDLLTGKMDFQRQADDITVFDMTGIALQDLTVAHLLRRQSEATGIGTVIDWPW